MLGASHAEKEPQKKIADTLLAEDLKRPGLTKRIPTGSVLNAIGLSMVISMPIALKLIQDMAKERLKSYCRKAKCSASVTASTTI